MHLFKIEKNGNILDLTTNEICKVITKPELNKFDIFIKDQEHSITLIGKDSIYDQLTRVFSKVYEKKSL